MFPDHVQERIRELEAELELTIGAGYDTDIRLEVYGATAAYSGYKTVELDGAGSITDVIDADPPSYSAIYNTHGDFVVGEVAPRLVYSYIGLTRSWVNAASVEELEAVLYEPIRRSVDPTFLAEYEAQQQVAQREAVESFAKSLYDSKIIAARGEITNAQRHIIQYGDSLALQYRILREAQQNLDALLVIQTHNGAETLLDEWDQLAGHARVASARFNGEDIILTTTDDVRMTNPVTEDTRWLGRFRIEINSAVLRVTIYNETTPRGGRDHPHVLDHRPCFGGHEHAFSELLAKGELYTLFELLLGYLETFNPDDEYGRYGAYWFDAPDARPSRLEMAA